MKRCIKEEITGIPNFISCVAPLTFCKDGGRLTKIIKNVFTKKHF